ncbi:MAG: aspartyl protease family protein [Planctomycetota bacterium]
MTRTWTVLLVVAIALACAQTGDGARDVAAVSTPALVDEAPTDWLPLELHRSVYPFVSGTVNGIATAMLIDSGAERTAIDASFARELGLESGGVVRARGISGATDAWIAHGVEIEIGALRIEPEFVVVIDLAPVVERLGRPLPVVLGRELFARAIVELDYPRERVALHDPERAPSADAARSITLFEVSGGKYAVDARIEGRPPVRVQVDTGSGDTLTIFHDYASAERLLAGRVRVSTRLAGGVGGSAVENEATLAELSLGEWSLRDVPALFEAEVRNAKAARACSGRLGGRVLHRFRVTIDAPHERMWLEPAERWSRPFERNRTGLQVVFRDEALEVVHVAAGSAAERSGWLVGERITSFVGRDVTSDYWSAWTKLLDGAPGTVVTLRDGSDNERKLTLADHY